MDNIEENRRVLIIDDDPTILKLYREILSVEEELPPNNYFGTTPEPEPEKAPPAKEHFEITTAANGQEGIEIACAEHDKGTPFPIAFIDMRMPPGIDGLETARNLRKLTPSIYIVIVTAYSDRSIDEIQQALEYDVIFLQKPFVHDVIFQLARTLCRSWNRDRALERAERREKYSAFKDGLSEMSSIVLDNIGNMILGVEASCNRVIETCNMVNQVGDNCRSLSQELDQAALQSDIEQLKTLQEKMVEAGRNLPEVLDKALWPSKSSLDAVRMGIEHIIKVLDLQRKNAYNNMHTDNFSLLQLIDDLELLTANELKALNISFQSQVESSLYDVSLPRNHLLNTLINLINNSMDAIQERISNKQLPPNDGIIKLRIAIINNQLHIHIEDNGAGITAENKPYIFEFGFTTRDGHGGFGLHAAGNFIGGCKGGIRVESEGENRGTLVNINMPTIV